jgi:hypothetical protein
MALMMACGRRTTAALPSSPAILAVRVRREREMATWAYNEVH